jgi:hypothetical protein
MVKAGKSQVRFRIRYLVFSIDLLLPAALGPGTDSISNRNE